MADVLPDIDAVVAANRAGRRRLGICGTEHHAPGRDNALSLPYHRAHRPGEHVLEKPGEEGLSGELIVVLAKQRLGRLHKLEPLQLVATLLEAAHDLADEAALDAVRLHHDVRALLVARHAQVRARRRRAHAERRRVVHQRRQRGGEGESKAEHDYAGKWQGSRARSRKHGENHAASFAARLRWWPLRWRTGPDADTRMAASSLADRAGQIQTWTLVLLCCCATVQSRLRQSPRALRADAVVKAARRQVRARRPAPQRAPPAVLRRPAGFDLSGGAVWISSPVEEEHLFSFGKTSSRAIAYHALGSLGARLPAPILSPIIAAFIRELVQLQLSPLELYKVLLGELDVEEVVRIRQGGKTNVQNSQVGRILHDMKEAVLVVDREAEDLLRRADADGDSALTVRELAFMLGAERLFGTELVLGSLGDFVILRSSSSTNVSPGETLRSFVMTPFLLGLERAITIAKRAMRTASAELLVLNFDADGVLVTADKDLSPWLLWVGSLPAPLARWLRPVVARGTPVFAIATAIASRLAWVLGAAGRTARAMDAAFGISLVCRAFWREGRNLLMRALNKPSRVDDEHKQVAPDEPSGDAGALPLAKFSLRGVHYAGKSSCTKRDSLMGHVHAEAQQAQRDHLAAEGSRSRVPLRQQLLRRRWLGLR